MAEHKYLKITDEEPNYFFASHAGSWLRIRCDQGRLTFDLCNIDGRPTLSPNGAARLAMWMAEATKG